MRRLDRVALLIAGGAALSFLLACNTSPMAGETAVLAGIVADFHGRPIAGARVTVSGNGVGISSTISQDDGTYRFPALRPFTEYRIAAAVRGFRPVEYDGMRLEAARTRVINFRLKKPGERDVVILGTRDPFPFEDFARGFSQPLNVSVRLIDLDAEPDPAEAVRRVAAERPDLILAAGLRAARLIRSDVRDVPVILALIGDPRRYDLEATNICFLANNPDADDLVRHFTTLLPHARRVGLVYDAETSALLARDIRAAAGRRGLRVEIEPCRSQGDVPPALDRLRERIDALLLFHDTLNASSEALRAITGWALRNHVPIAAPDPEWVRRGALYSYGVPLQGLGQEASRIAAQILFHMRQPSDFRLQIPDNAILAVNRETATALGVAIPPGVTFDLAY